MVSLRECWKISSNKQEDSFVGLRFSEQGVPEIIFPMGFSVSKSDSDDEVRRAAILLMMTFQKFEKSLNDALPGIYLTSEGKKESVFFSCYRVIQYYMQYGYYHDIKISYKNNTNGKISWNKTIKRIRPIFDENDAYYLRFITRKREIETESLIYQINKYCVYVSIQILFWMFPKVAVEIPDISFNKSAFENVLCKFLNKTFDDTKTSLFKDMLAIVRESSIRGNLKLNELKVGTSQFEYVWENIIDKLYGEANKEKYFPSANWLINGEEYKSSSLRPDTIMLPAASENLFILDAKYYKYGVTNNPSDLPDTASINKQITYGEYASGLPVCVGKNIYSVFVLPYDKQNYNNKKTTYQYVGKAVSQWKSEKDTKNISYYSVYAVLADVRTLMDLYTISSPDEKYIFDKKLDEIIATNKDA